MHIYPLVEAGLAVIQLVLLVGHRVRFYGRYLETPFVP